MKLTKSKKGNAFKLLINLAVSMAIIAVLLVTTFLVLSEGRSQIGVVEGLDSSVTTNSSECVKSLSCNATAEIQKAVDDIPGWLPIFVIAVVGAALLGLVGLFKRGG